MARPVEGFFGDLKNGIRGNYHSVSSRWLQGYLNEYAWRWVFCVSLLATMSADKPRLR